MIFFYFKEKENITQLKAFSLYIDIGLKKYKNSFFSSFQPKVIQQLICQEVQTLKQKICWHMYPLHVEHFRCLQTVKVNKIKVFSYFLVFSILPYTINIISLRLIAIFS